MKRKLILALMTICCIFLYSGCSLMLEEPSALITPPANDQKQYQERKLINAILADDEYLEVPSHMDKPAASVDIDADGDGEKEKLVFWVKGNGFETGATILKRTQEGDWVVLDRARQSGRTIDYFNMVDIDQDGKKEIFLGVDIGGYNTLYIYRLSDKGFEAVEQMNYSLLDVVDVYDSGKKQLICALSAPNSNVPKTSLNMYQWENSAMKRMYHKEFDGSCQGMAFGLVDKNHKGLYLAESNDFSTVNIILLLPDKKNGFEEQMTSTVMYLNTSLGQKTIDDVNGDGVLEVRSILQPTDASKREPSDFLQIWKGWDGNVGLDIVYGVIHNKSDGYEFVFPTYWLNNIRYQFVTEKGSSQIRIYDGNAEEPAFVVYAQDENSAKQLNKNPGLIALGSTPSRQRQYFAKRNTETFAGHELTDAMIKGAFYIEGDQ